MAFDRYASLIIFFCTYCALVFIPRRRMHSALAGSFLLLVLGVVSPAKAFLLINWNVMGIFWGTLVVAELFMASNAPAYFAEVVVERTSNAVWAILAICVLTSILSAFVENVATVLIIAPVALAITDRLHISPVPMIISLAVSSNLQGAATLIGDPPSMLLAGFAKMTFNDFFVYQGRPGIFFAVQLGALASFATLYWIFRHMRQEVHIERTQRVHSWTPLGMLVVMIVLLALSSFIDPGFGYMAGVICTLFGIAGALWHAIFRKGNVLRLFTSLDWQTTFFLMGVFVVVGALTEVGWVEDVVPVFTRISGDNVFVAYTVIVWISVLFSAFIDNVPYLLAMLPVAQALAAKLGVSDTLLLFGLLIGASIGGNITPIGASANIVSVGILSRRGHHVSLKEFAKIGLPFTIVATLTAYAFLWFVWH
ncbi:MAG: SLC13 family permease [Candidatus Abyssubacteria bacterium]